MNALHPSARHQANTDVQPRLSTTVEGVEFWINVSRTARVRCVITESALQGHYGAAPDQPDTWLAAFERHRFDIERRALGATGRRDDVHVVIVTNSAGALHVVAGRCTG